MTSSIDRRSNHWNRTDDSDVNRGNKSKFNSAQLEERAKLHSIRLATGKPTIQGIVDHWFTKYGITIHYNSEKEWAWRNEKVILASLDDMVANGEVKMNLNDTTLINTINVSGTETGKLIKGIEEQVKRLMKSIDFEFNPYKKLKMSVDDFLELKDEQAKKTKEKIRIQSNMNKMKIEMLHQLAGMLRDHKRILIETVNTTKSLFDDSKIKEVKMNNEIAKRLNQKMLENTGMDPMDVEVTDEHRQKIMNAP